MTNMKESVLAALQGSELTVPQIVEQLGIKTKDPCNDARTYVNRLKAEGKVREVSKAGKAKVYTASSPASDAQDPRIINCLKFYKDMFERFSETIVSHPEIMDYVIENQEKIKEAEAICQRS